MELIRPGMGTENALEIIAVMIKMARPLSILEVGAGDSTVAIADAIVAAKAEYLADKELVHNTEWAERSELLIPHAATSVYEPKFISIDNFSAPGCSAAQAWNTLNTAKYAALSVKTINCDFHNLSLQFFDDNLFDFIWLDAGSLVDDIRFIGKLWSRLAAGGFMVFHDPYFTVPVQEQTTQHQKLAMIRTPLWEFINKSDIKHVDILSIPEMHKYRQTGLGIIRKHHQWEENRRELFQEEMSTIGLAPVRFRATSLLSETLEQRNELTRQLMLLKNQSIRSVYCAVALGISELSEIQRTVKLDKEKVLRLLAKLMDAQMIRLQDGGYFENPQLWETLVHTSANDRMFNEFSDTKLEEAKYLDLIVSYLQPQKTYNEHEISSYCACFTDDFARLRRKLVDSKRLIRKDGIYQRI